MKQVTNRLKKRMPCVYVLLLNFIVCGVVIAAIGLVGAERALAQRGRVYGDRVRLNWLDDDAFAWYSVERRSGRREFVLIDTAKKERRPAFDHDKLIQAMKDAGLEKEAASLDLPGFRVDPKENTVYFFADDKYFCFDNKTNELSQVETDEANQDAATMELPNTRIPRSGPNGAEVWLTIVNKLEVPVSLYWRDSSGGRQAYGKIAAGESHRQHTFASHVWEVADEEGETIELFRADDSGRQAIVDRELHQPELPRGARGGGRFEGRSGRRVGGTRRFANAPTLSRPLTSADDSKSVYVEDGNVFLVIGDGEEGKPLTEDGSDDHAYARLEWAPDNKTLIAFQIREYQTKEVHLVESSPREEGRAVLHTRPYALPGDPFNEYTLTLIDTTSGKVSKPIGEPIDFGSPNVRWFEGENRFTLEKVDRGHQRFRLFDVDVSSHSAPTLIDEQTNTFIWTAHRHYSNDRLVTWLDDSNRAIYLSEMSGWRHMYLVDATNSSSGDATKKMQPITSGEFVVKSIERIDEDNEQIWFSACGREPNQDPYFVHYYRVDFDGENLTHLTDGNGTHEIDYSPTEKYLIDSFSRVDMAPVHTLRNAETGELVCELEKADMSELLESGWQPPEVFSAMGRDGETSIWGFVCRPMDFDPSKKYPVIEDIYAGPHDSHVPKSFRAAQWYSSLTRLGFVVAKVDGMGTANRSKAFHDVCWQNVKDAGFPDRIAWHKAFAEEHEWYDVERVGIYGTSAGGQNSTGALLFHGDFYDVAVSACGCHDNRMDKASWNEQWMGYPVGPHYSASSNIDNAGNLTGKLLLIVGEMDTNVPPESTMRLVDALIKADKDFDLLVVPGGGHGMGGRYGQRRMHDFFVRHLLDREPPDRNAE